MIKKIFILITLAAATLQANADNLMKGLVVKTRRGYNIGGTAPLPMPASIRSLNDYSFKANWSLGVDATKPLDDRWGVAVGLRFEAKGMKIDADVKTITKYGAGRPNARRHVYGLGGDRCQAVDVHGACASLVESVP